RVRRQEGQPARAARDRRGPRAADAGARVVMNPANAPPIRRRPVWPAPAGPRIKAKFKTEWDFSRPAMPWDGEQSAWMDWWVAGYNEGYSEGTRDALANRVEEAE